jgi:hypothetical protein
MGRRSDARRKARLTETEIAFLEVLDAWERVVELPAVEAIERLEKLFDSGVVDVSKAVRAAAHEPARSRARLKAVLELLGRSEAALNVPGCSTPRVRARALEPFAGALT